MHKNSSANKIYFLILIVVINNLLTCLGFVTNLSSFVVVVLFGFVISGGLLLQHISSNPCLI